MRTLLLTLLTLLVVAMPVEAKKNITKTALSAKSANEEFRGTWIQTAWQDRYARMSPADCQRYLTRLVDKLHGMGFNAIIFQVRPEGDAFYRSDYEPWSRFLTGRQGQAPSVAWDPMAYLIDLCHQRNMEFHAWLNPYRMTMSKSVSLASDHLYKRNPEWFVLYDDKLYLNPGLPESRNYIRTIVKDIVTRYDVDAIHMDDYFYPYPVAGKTFDDQWAYETYAPQMGFSLTTKEGHDKFRRRSVDILIKSIHADVHAIKPWVRFGVSPFGIYRNKASWPQGSATNGTQCYDDLYADVLFWMQSGWVDYVIPQIYWEIGHRAADYTTLVRWWDEHCPASCHLYIGQSIERSLDGSAATADLCDAHTNFSSKLNQVRQGVNTRGNCFWYAYQIDENQYHVADYLAGGVFAEPALLPRYTHIDAVAPEKLKKVKGELLLDNEVRKVHIHWQQPETRDPMQLPHYYNVYRVRKGGKSKPTDISNLFLQTSTLEFYDASVVPGGKYVYYIAPVDACHNEGKPVKMVAKIKRK